MTTILNCEHEKQEMVMNRKIHERPYVRRPRQTLKLQRNPRTVRVCPSSTLSVPPALGAVWGCAPGPGGGLGKCPQRWGLPGGVPPAMGAAWESAPSSGGSQGICPRPCWWPVGLGKRPQPWGRLGEVPPVLEAARGFALSPVGGLWKCPQPEGWPGEVPSAMELACGSEGKAWGHASRLPSPFQN